MTEVLLRRAGKGRHTGYMLNDVSITARQHRVAALVAEGISTEEIAARLWLSPRSVEGHLYRLYHRLKIKTRAELRALWEREPRRCLSCGGVMSQVSPAGDLALSIRPRDIVRVVSHTTPAVSRLALVTAVSGGHAAILLATSPAELATEHDLVVRRGITGLPYDLAIQAELYGRVGLSQIDRKLATVPFDLVDAVSRALVSDGESLERYETGHPLGGVDDLRRGLKDEDLQALHWLTC